MTEDDYLPLSYLNDLLFCERRAALHLNEQIWKDNQFVKGLRSCLIAGVGALRRLDDGCGRALS